MISDARACDLEGKSLQTYSKNPKKSTGKGVGSFSQQFPCFLVHDRIELRIKHANYITDG